MRCRHAEAVLCLNGRFFTSSASARMCNSHAGVVVAACMLLMLREAARCVSALLKDFSDNV